MVANILWLSPGAVMKIRSMRPAERTSWLPPLDLDLGPTTLLGICKIVPFEQTPNNLVA